MMNSSAPRGHGFDLDRHLREKRRRLERENVHLRAYVERLETVLAVALRCATAGRACSALDLLAAIEEIVDRTEVAA